MFARCEKVTFCCRAAVASRKEVNCSARRSLTKLASTFWHQAQRSVVTAMRAVGRTRGHEAKLRRTRRVANAAVQFSHAVPDVLGTCLLHFPVAPNDCFKWLEN
ncbi:hypothetical protein TRVL_08795 [Trypanosoma vivax]|nr:hypothetical protein TRVL_08795 [Trypanosoma vivax]